MRENMKEEMRPLNSFVGKQKDGDNTAVSRIGSTIVKYAAKQDWKAGDVCPNCRKGRLEQTTAIKSEFESRYHYLLFCPYCKFKYLKKFGVTGSGKIKTAGFTDAEFRKAYNKLILRR